LLSFLSWL